MKTKLKYVPISFRETLPFFLSRNCSASYKYRFKIPTFFKILYIEKLFRPKALKKTSRKWKHGTKINNRKFIRFKECLKQVSKQ